ncbi:MAG: ATP-dependent protease ATPase subunit HslU [Pyrinomonadaceae bacterium]|nr:ATP-dependent protease ATPase subunit HslU [Pyrinomonadaceae bacterium]MCX7640984.1 ATP-dependent protease ATPase subunit HslU [Pyrinomonadaceae bacterium]MDW8305092.1 ATP-dependent protease ATPase subunit HslU [Acidobacteriota bacterium]
MTDLTPKQIVAELDKYIIGQNKAKKAVAIALRNRIRRQKLPREIAQEILPKNILMIGPTGVGKTEIARRLAKLSNSPFIKVEASKFTEVGYVGRDVESMIRELTEVAVEMTKQAAFKEVRPKAEANAEERILDMLIPHQHTDTINRTREKLREQLKKGLLDDRIIEIEVQDRPTIDIIGFGGGLEELNFNEVINNLLPKRSKRKKLKISEAKEFIIREEQENLVDMDSIIRAALEKAQNSGIIFIDEIDKIASRQSIGPDVSREGVQRDLLPIVEGTNVNTRYGMVNTEHILFIAAGAFHLSKPSDLIPELQGRFPIRVELDPLSKEDFKRILIEPKNSLIKQYQALLSTEDILLDFTEDAIEAIAEMAETLNQVNENIGARRLHTIMEKLLEDISFEGADIDVKHQIIDKNFVINKLEAIVKNKDLSNYIL